MAMQLIQTVSEDTAIISPRSLAIDNVQAGSTLVLCAGYSGNNRGFVVEDQDGDSWVTYTTSYAGAKTTIIAVCPNDDKTGTVTPTIATFPSTAAVDIYTILIFEITGSAASQAMYGGETSNANSHYFADVGGKDIKAESFICCTAFSNFSHGGATPGPNYTEALEAPNLIVQYRITSGALTGERPEWTSSTARQSTNQCVVFTEKSSGGTGGGGIKVAGRGGGIAG